MLAHIRQCSKICTGFQDQPPEVWITPYGWTRCVFAGDFPNPSTCCTLKTILRAPHRTHKRTSTYPDEVTFWRDRWDGVRTNCFCMRASVCVDLARAQWSLVSPKSIHQYNQANSGLRWHTVHCYFCRFSTVSWSGFICGYSVLTLVDTALCDTTPCKLWKNRSKNHSSVRRIFVKCSQRSVIDLVCDAFAGYWVDASCSDRQGPHATDHRLNCTHAVRLYNRRSFIFVFLV